MSKAPHVQASFINALAEEGTRDELVQYLQEQWNETCAAKSETRAAVAAALEAAAQFCTDNEVGVIPNRGYVLGPFDQGEHSGTHPGMAYSPAIRALITDRDSDALAAHVAAEVAKARAEDAAWFPMESAPRDGTVVLVGGGTWIDQSETYPQKLPLSTAETAYFSEFEGWIMGNSETYGEYLIAFPSGWKPLPDTPALAQIGAKP